MGNMQLFQAVLEAVLEGKMGNRLLFQAVLEAVFQGKMGNMLLFQAVFEGSSRVSFMELDVYSCL